jgi:hypothetical protein
MSTMGSEQEFKDAAVDFLKGHNATEQWFDSVAKDNRKL